MVSEFATLGSCSSRNIFYSRINENYKTYFHINRSLEFVNMISLMSNPIEYDEKLIDAEREYDNEHVKLDLNKKYIDFLKEDNMIEYLIIDTFFDVEFNNIIVGKNQLMTESTRLKNTTFYDTVKDYEKISIQENFDEYFELWKKSYEDFFRFMHENRPDIKIILNCSRSVYKYLKDGEVRIHRGFLTRAKDNKYRNILDEYLLENYDLDILPFDETTFTDIYHIFGRHPTHYESRYYTEKTYQLNEIINRNDTLGWDNELNKNIRQLVRKNQIIKMGLLNHYHDQDDEIDELNKKNKKLTKRNTYLESELDAVLNSNSWKMTEPLRNLKRKL